MIVWALVKMMNSGNKWDGGTVEKKGEEVHKFTVCGKGGVVCWNDTGVELYTILRGFSHEIQANHWGQSWQEY